MNYAFSRVDIGPIAQMHALRRLVGPEQSYPTEAVAALARLTRAQRIARGTQLVKTGEPFTMIFIVADGALEITYDDEHFGTFGAGTGVGALYALAQAEPRYGCRAIEDSTVFAIQVAEYLEVIEDHFELLHGIIRNFAAQALEWRRVLLPTAGFTSEVREPCYPCGAHPLGLVERILYMRHTIGLEESYIDELADLARAATELRLPAGTQLWRASDSATFSIALISGEVLAHTPEGASFRFGPGDSVGDLDAIASVPRWFDARAERDLVALAVDSDAFVDVWEDHPSFGLTTLRMLARVSLALRFQAHRLHLPIGERPISQLHNGKS